jgi:hypothetical protein
MIAVGKIVYSSYGNPYCEYNMAEQCAYIYTIDLVMRI